MATGGLGPETELSEDLLSCDVCSKDFDYDARTPRILPCFHSFCESCLQHLTKDGACRCPKCGCVSGVTQRLPVDVTRVTVMDARRALQGGLPCGGCTGNARAAARCQDCQEFLCQDCQEFLCQDCQEFLCQDCCAAHRKMKVFKGHAVLSLSAAVRSPGDLPTSLEKCARHLDEKLKLFCVTCSAAACATCALVAHKKCEHLVDMASILDDKKKEMTALCEELDKLQQDFRVKAEGSEASVQTVDSSLNEAVHKVEGVYAEVINTALATQENDIRSLKARAQWDKVQLGEQAARFRSLQAAAQTPAQFGRRCVSLGLVSQVFTHTPRLAKVVQELRKKSTAGVQPAPAYKVSAETEAALQDLLLGLVRVVPYIELDASRSPRWCRVGKASALSVTSPAPAAASAESSSFTALVAQSPSQTPEVTGK